VDVKTIQLQSAFHLAYFRHHLDVACWCQKFDRHNGVVDLGIVRNDRNIRRAPRLEDTQLA
jgi:hypothetical protein